jgi:hypothetical protein
MMMMNRGPSQIAYVESVVGLTITRSQHIARYKHALSSPIDPDNQYSLEYQACQAPREFVFHRTWSKHGARRASRRSPTSGLSCSISRKVCIMIEMVQRTIAS